MYHDGVAEGREGTELRSIRRKMMDFMQPNQIPPEMIEIHLIVFYFLVANKIND